MDATALFRVHLSALVEVDLRHDGRHQGLQAAAWDLFCCDPHFEEAALAILEHILLAGERALTDGRSQVQVIVQCLRYKRRNCLRLLSEVDFE